jgi:hypothetical protein
MEKQEIREAFKLMRREECWDAEGGTLACLERRVFADGEIESIGIQILAETLKTQCPSTFTI